MNTGFFRNRPSIGKMSRSASTDQLRQQSTLEQSATPSERPNTSDHTKINQTAPKRPGSARKTHSTPRPPTPKESQSASQRRSFMKMRYASDPQLSTRFKNDAVESTLSTSDAAPAPVIGITAPPLDESAPQEIPKRRFRPFRNQSAARTADRTTQQTLGSALPGVGGDLLSPTNSTTHSSFDSSPRRSTNSFQNERTDSGRESSRQPDKRLSRFWRSDRSEIETDGNPAEQDIPKTNGAANRFKFTRRKDKQTSLFPLPPKGERLSIDQRPSTTAEERSSTFGNVAIHADGSNETPATAPASYQPTAATSPAADYISSPFGPRPQSVASTRSGKSTPIGFGNRGRSGTMNSFSSPEYHRGSASQFQDSGRNSTASTTLGRNSMVGLRSLTSRLRGPSETHISRKGSPASAANPSSHSNSFAMSRENLVVPEREEGESSGKYFSRLEKDIPKKSIALLFSKKSDAFSHDVLRSLMRTFKFYEEPIDIAIRRFLWEIALPGEAQQIDRVISAFAERYHECNPHIFDTLDQAYVIGYSLIILHSDLFNKNNKRKMQRQDYQRNTRGHGLTHEILGYLYDNIQYTEFIAQNSNEEENETRSKASGKKSRQPRAKPVTPETSRPNKVDPYDIIIDDKLKLDVLRPSLKEVLNMEDSFNYQGTADRFDVRTLRAAFSRYGILQVMSARSRPEAFTSPSTITNPFEAHPGVVDIRVAKVGVLWRKDPRKKKTRSPWQEWGAILTPSQLFFFRNAGWVKGLLHQFESHQKYGNKKAPVTFMPPLENFTFDVRVPTLQSVALVDSSYKRHKHAFVLARRGTPLENGRDDSFFEETLLADNEFEVNDWLARLNWASTFASAGVPMRASPIANNMTLLPPTVGEDPVTLLQPGDGMIQSTSAKQPQELDVSLATQIKTARRVAIANKIVQLDDDVVNEMKNLEEELKTARHLQILAPFPAKTRSELLGFGARLSHRLKWSRYEIWRMKCHKDILKTDMSDEDKTFTVERSNSSLQVTTTPNNKSNTLLPTEPKPIAQMTQLRSPQLSKVSSRLSTSSIGNQSKESYIVGGIDEAFATPPETLMQLGNSPDGVYTLPPINFSSNDFDDVSKRSQSLNMSDMVERGRNGSTSTVGINGGSIGTNGDAVLSNPLTADPSRTESIVPGEELEHRERPSTGIESDHERGTAYGSPESKTRIRRSLQRTLRESRDTHINGHQRSRKGRESMSGSRHGKDDSKAGRESESLARGKGPFTVHGKQASVITLGSEWQQISAEERLKLRKQAQGVGSKSHELQDLGDESDASTEYESPPQNPQWLPGGGSGEEDDSNETKNRENVVHRSSSSTAISHEAILNGDSLAEKLARAEELVDATQHEA